MKEWTKMTIGLPWWLSGKEFTCQCRRHRFDPWARKIPHVSKQLIPLLNSTTTTEPVLKSLGAHLLNPHAATTEGCVPRAQDLQQEKPPQWEDLTPQLELSPHWPQLEKSLHRNKDPAQLKKKKKKDHRSTDQKKQVHTNLGLCVKKQTGWYCVPFLQGNGDSSYPWGQNRSRRMKDCDMVMTKCYAQVSCSKDSLKVLWAGNRLNVGPSTF